MNNLPSAAAETVLRLTDNLGAEAAYADKNGASFCSLIAWAVPAAGLIPWYFLGTQ